MWCGLKIFQIDLRGKIRQVALVESPLFCFKSQYAIGAKIFKLIFSDLPAALP